MKNFQQFDGAYGKFLKIKSGAGNQVRTGDLNLGKVALYQLSYSRFEFVNIHPRQLAFKLKKLDIYKALNHSENTKVNLGLGYE